MKKYNLSEIMTIAWQLFRGDRESLELDANPTFSECLKLSWEMAKEFVEEQERFTKQASSSEEVKAFNWASKKMGIELVMTDIQKQRAVNDADQESWTSNVWKSAMKAVRMIMISGSFEQVA